MWGNNLKRMKEMEISEKDIYSYISILWTGRPGVLQAMGLQSRTRLSDGARLILFQIQL